MTDKTDDTPTHFQGTQEAVAGLIEVTRSAIRTVTIFSHELDHNLFDVTQWLDTLSRFARSSANAQVNILLSDSRPAVSRGHQLVKLARRLPSHISILKRSTDDYEANNFLLADRSAYWLMPDWQTPDGHYHLNDPVQVQHLYERYDEFNRHSAPDPELRIFSL